MTIKLRQKKKIAAVEEDAKAEARNAKQLAWENFMAPIREQVQQAMGLYNDVVSEGGSNAALIAAAVRELAVIKELFIHKGRDGS